MGRRERHEEQSTRVEAGVSGGGTTMTARVMAQADWIIDLGPGAGHDGGRIVFEGTPADLVAKKLTLTGQHLAAFVGSRRKAVAPR